MPLPVRSALPAPACRLRATPASRFTVGALLLPVLLAAAPAHAAPAKGRKKAEKKVVPEEDEPATPPPAPVAPAPVAPPPPSPALPHIVAGNALFKEEKYAEAAVELRKAYALDPKPKLLFNIASAQRRAGQLREAQATYREYLKVEPQGELKDKAEAHIASLDTAIAEQDRRFKPFYKRAWFWGVVGGVVVAAGLGVGLGIGLKPSPPKTDLGILLLQF